ncbi:hypothetical protein JQ616_13985 [Bradyrhizobium tropiciagri]|uniref:hypothetical protein n=1 Tax=Bradyrhizobium tropiciagri TaxID=312253 RepID=UPI001BA552A7|nr:hypothetical protein [Bradyrhizobium tropiciagri]MBR0896065.1 hypothetical protein [Bradyrhizobium tropiciagri]
MTFAIKTEIRDPGTVAFTFTAQKTMYGGKHVAAGGIVFEAAAGARRAQALQSAPSPIRSANALCRPVCAEIMPKQTSLRGADQRCAGSSYAQKVAASHWGMAGRARTGLGRGGVGM